MKKIAVQKGLDNITEELRKEGYSVVGFNNNEYVDAIVYVDDYEGIKGINNQFHNEAGAIMVNALGKSIDEIKYIIERRRYEGIF